MTANRNRSGILFRSCWAVSCPPGLLVIPGWFGVKRDWLKKPFTRLLLCWTIIPFLFFSASSCKLGTYILPCFPPLAMLLAIAVRKRDA